MNKRFLIPAIGLLALMAACVPSANEDSHSDNTPGVKQPDMPLLTDDCPADDLQGLVGESYQDGMVAYDGRIRVIPPGSAVTMDYLPSRLNIATDSDGIITRISCG